MIKFTCGKCGAKFKLPDGSSGKNGQCPKCKSPIVVPLQKTAPTDEDMDFLPIAVPQEGGGNYSIAGLGEEAAASKPQHPSVGEEFTPYPPYLQRSKSETVLPARRLPAFIDIFLYPINASALLTLLSFWACLIILVISVWLLSFIVYGFVFALIAAAVLCDVIFCYFIECARDSADGAIRAQGTLPLFSDFMDFGAILEKVLPFVFCWMPLVIYCIFVRQIDAIFVLLSAYGVFFFPMVFLAVTMFQSRAALNPLLWIASIFSTFFRYCFLVFSLWFIVAASCAISWAIISKTSSSIVLFCWGLLGSAFHLYLGLVLCHMLGRFYYRNADKLNWEV